MKVAIVGSGFIANIHAQAIKSLGHTIEVVVSTSCQKAQAFAEKWNIKNASADFKDALTDEISVVHICTPPTTHYAQVKQALLSDKHVICEKPLCTSAVEAKELYELAKKTGKVNATGFNVRFHEACGRAKGIIGAPGFGSLCFIHGTYLQEFHSLPADYMWRYNKELAGPMRATTEIGSHVVDLMRYWTGLEIIAVSATFSAFTPDRYLKDNVMYREKVEGGEGIRVNSEDVAMAALRFSNGAVGHMLLSEVSHGRSNYLKLEVSGTNQSVWWESENPYHLHTGSKFSGALDNLNAFGGGFMDTFQSLFTNVYGAIEGEKREFPTFYDGYVNGMVLDAIYNSAHNNSQWTEVIF